MSSAFATWLTSQGVVLHSGVHISQDATGLSVRSTRAIRDGEALVTVPESLLLSVKTASSPATAALLDAAADDESLFPDSAVQTLVVALELMRGSASRWAPYFAALTIPDVPIMWTDDELGLLAGSGVDRAALEWRAKLHAEHRTLLGCLRSAQCGPSGEAMAAVSLLAYMQAAVLMASRAFYIGPTHGDALVPAADLFNHKIALDEDEDAEESSAAVVGPRPIREAGGTLRESVRAIAARDGLDLDLDCAFDGLDEDEDEDEDEDGNDGDDGVVDDGVDDDGEEAKEASPPRFVTQLSLRRITAGREICTTYGEFGNAKLFLDFGFVIDDNPLDTVELTADDLSAACTAFDASAATTSTAPGCEDHGGTSARPTLSARLQRVRSMQCMRSTTAGSHPADRFIFDRLGVAPLALRDVVFLLSRVDVGKPSGKPGKLATAFPAGWASLAPAEQLHRAGQTGRTLLRTLLHTQVRRMEDQIEALIASGGPPKPAGGKAKGRGVKRPRDGPDAESSSPRRALAVAFLRTQLSAWRTAEAWLEGTARSA